MDPSGGLGFVRDSKPLQAWAFRQSFIIVNVTNREFRWLFNLSDEMQSPHGPIASGCVPSLLSSRVLLSTNYYDDDTCQCQSLSSSCNFWGGGGQKVAYVTPASIDSRHLGKRNRPWGPLRGLNYLCFYPLLTLGCKKEEGWPSWLLLQALGAFALTW